MFLPQTKKAPNWVKCPVEISNKRQLNNTFKYPNPISHPLNFVTFYAHQNSQLAAMVDQMNQWVIEQCSVPSSSISNLSDNELKLKIAELDYTIYEQKKDLENAKSVEEWYEKSIDDKDKEIASLLKSEDKLQNELIVMQNQNKKLKEQLKIQKMKWKEACKQIKTATEARYITHIKALKYLEQRITQATNRMKFKQKKYIQFRDIQAQKSNQKLKNSTNKYEQQVANLKHKLKEKISDACKEKICNKKLQAKLERLENSQYESVQKLLLCDQLNRELCQQVSEKNKIIQDLKEQLEVFDQCVKALKEQIKKKMQEGIAVNENIQLDEQHNKSKEDWKGRYDKLTIKYNNYRATSHKLIKECQKNYEEKITGLKENRKFLLKRKNELKQKNVNLVTQLTRILAETENFLLKKYNQDPVIKQSMKNIRLMLDPEQKKSAMCVECPKKEVYFCPDVSLLKACQELGLWLSHIGHYLFSDPIRKPFLQQLLNRIFKTGKHHNDANMQLLNSILKVNISNVVLQARKMATEDYVYTVEFEQKEKKVIRDSESKIIQFLKKLKKKLEKKACSSLSKLSAILVSSFLEQAYFTAATASFYIATYEWEKDPTCLVRLVEDIVEVTKKAKLYPMSILDNLCTHANDIAIVIRDYRRKNIIV